MVIGLNTVLYGAGWVPWMSLEGLAIPFVLALLWSLVPNNLWPTWLTKSAFSIYVIHSFVLALLTAFVFRRHGDCVQFVLKVVLASLSSIGIAVMLRRYVPRSANVLFGGR